MTGSAGAKLSDREVGGVFSFGLKPGDAGDAGDFGEPVLLVLPLKRDPLWMLSIFDSGVKDGNSRGNEIEDRR